MPTTQTDLETLPASPYATLVTLTWGEENEARYCRWTQDLDVGGEIFVSAPEMSCVFDKALSGGTEDCPLSITIRTDRTPFDKLCLSFPHARVTVLVQEIDPSDESTLRDIFYGTLDEVTLKPRSSDLCENRCVTPKSRFQRTISLQALTTCAWVFGDQNSSPCGIALDDIKETTTLTDLNIDGAPNRVRLEFSGTPDLTALRWKRGFLECDGLRIKVRKLADAEDATHATFDLAQIPPTEWEDNTIVACPGCDGQLETCRYWNNESQFMGFGAKMPNYNPIWEKGG